MRKLAGYLQIGIWERVGFQSLIVNWISFRIIQMEINLTIFRIRGIGLTYHHLATPDNAIY